MHTTQAIPRELEDKVKRELEPTEKVYWMEQPIPRFFTPTSTKVFLFGIPWTAFLIWSFGHSLLNLTNLIRDFKDFGFFILFGIPFLLIGFGLLASPLWAYWKALKTVYVITDHRAITFDAGWKPMIRSYSPHHLQNVYRKENKDGTGDVILGQRIVSGSEVGKQTEDIGFINIRNPKKVEQMLRELAEPASG